MGSTPVISLETNEWPVTAAIRPSAIVSAMNAKTETRHSDAERDAPCLRELLQAVAKKDRTAFDAFYNATTERVLSLVLRITRQIDVAEEVVSDVYLARLDSLL